MIPNHKNNWNGTSATSNLSNCWISFYGEAHQSIINTGTKVYGCIYYIARTGLKCNSNLPPIELIGDGEQLVTIDGKTCYYESFSLFRTMGECVAYYNSRITQHLLHLAKQQTKLVKQVNLCMDRLLDCDSPAVEVYQKELLKIKI